jgi:hypothetical protein
MIAETLFLILLWEYIAFLTRYFVFFNSKTDQKYGTLFISINHTS